MAFEEAKRFNCTRPELANYIVQTKKLLGDWSGLYHVTKSLSSNEAHRDVWLDAFAVACDGLIAIARIRGDWKRVAELAFEVVERISLKLQRQKVTSGYFQELLGRRFDFARDYFEAVAQNATSAGDQIDVFDAAIRLAEHEIILSDLIKRAVKALQIWWTSVEGRRVIDETARSILSRQVRRLNNLEKQIAKIGKANSELTILIRDASHDLAFKGANYGRAA